MCETARAVGPSLKLGLVFVRAISPGKVQVCDIYNLLLVSVLGNYI